MRHKRILRTVLPIFYIFLFHLHPPSTLGAEKASVQEILSNPDKYDGQGVAVQGRAFKVRTGTSKKGNEYTTFTLTTGRGRELDIFTWGHPGIREGKKS
jgi:hypothetical protein